MNTTHAASVTTPSAAPGSVDTAPSGIGGTRQPHALRQHTRGHEHGGYDRGEFRSWHAPQCREPELAKC